MVARLVSLPRLAAFEQLPSLSRLTVPAGQRLTSWVSALLCKVLSTTREAPLLLSIIKKPSAYLPIAMSLTALALVLIHAARYGIVHEADEGTTAHLFQILMAAQVPLVAFFALKWLPEVPGQALRVIALQICVALAAFASVYWLT